MALTTGKLIDSETMKPQNIYSTVFIAVYSKYKFIKAGDSLHGKVPTQYGWQLLEPGHRQ